MSIQRERRSTLFAGVLFLLVLLGSIVAFSWFAVDVSRHTASLEQDLGSVRDERKSLHGDVEVLQNAVNRANKRLTALGEAPVIPAPVTSSPGATGATGASGRPGRDGRDGRDGTDGTDGQIGPAGADGQPGAPGRDGKDATCEGEFVCEDELNTLLAGYATESWVRVLFDALGCEVSIVDGPPNQVFSCSITGTR